MADDRMSRRALLTAAAAAAGTALVAAGPSSTRAQKAGPTAPPPPHRAPVDPTKVIGAPTSPVGARSTFEHPARAPAGIFTGSSFTPLQDLDGTITPSDLHFERHHAGVPALNPARHELVIHGMVDRPTVFTVDALKRYPSVTRIYFLECSGNGRAAYHAPKPEMSPQVIDGLTSNSEWTGVPLRLLLDEAGVRSGAQWFLAEGGDASLMARSIPLNKGLDDALIVYAQNGEALRPEQGYPIRLLLPGFEGNMNVKWLRRLKLGAQPFMTRWETAKYTDPLPNDSARIFSFVMDAKSIITSPAYPRVVTGRGWWPITGIAWTGRGRIARVEVSTDAGKTWRTATLQDPVVPRAHTRFHHMWNWDGRETVILSRATDDTGYTQPTHAQFARVRGPGTDYHYNWIRAWRVKADGTVLFEVDT